MDVKYRVVVVLKSFACADTPLSSFVSYENAQRYMLINLRGAYYR